MTKKNTFFYMYNVTNCCLISLGKYKHNNYFHLSILIYKISKYVLIISSFKVFEILYTTEMHYMFEEQSIESINHFPHILDSKFLRSHLCLLVL